MFRGLTFMVNGKMCVSVSGDKLMCRFDPQRTGQNRRPAASRCLLPACLPPVAATVFPSNTCATNTLHQPCLIRYERITLIQTRSLS